MASPKDLGTLVLQSLSKIIALQESIRPSIDQLQAQLKQPKRQPQRETVWRIRHRVKMLTAVMGSLEMASSYLIKAIDIDSGSPLYWSRRDEEE